MSAKSPAVRKSKRSPTAKRTRSNPPLAAPEASPIVLLAGAILVLALGAILVVQFRERYSVTWQSPVKVQFQSPVVIAAKTKTEDASEAQTDQGRPLTAYQQYACRKFGPACRVALAIQRAENQAGKCETYHYNTNGTLDWGYFQINTVHLTRPGLNLRDLLDCKANIDFAYQLYQERGFAPWSTYNNGAYRKYLHQ